MKNTNTTKLITLGIILAFSFMTMSPLLASANNGNGNGNNGKDRENHGLKLGLLEDIKAEAKIEAKEAKVEAKVQAKAEARLHNDGNNGVGWIKFWTHGWMKKNEKNKEDKDRGNENGNNEKRNPKILDIDLVRGTTTAQIMVKTNEPTTVEIRYSATSTNVSSSSLIVLSSTASTTHKLTLTGLAVNTKYFYVVSVKDADNNVKKSKVMSFSTRTIGSIDIVAPQILFSAAVDIKARSANIIWGTNELANGRLWLSTSTPINATGTPRQTDVNFSYFHNVRLNDLATSTQYFYAISSTDKEGNVSVMNTGSFVTPSM